MKRWLIFAQWIVLLTLFSCGGPVVVDNGNDNNGHTGPRTLTAVEDFELAVELFDPTSIANIAEVIDLLESAIDRDPGFSEAWFNLGVARQTAGDIEGAIEAYTQSNVVDETNFDGPANIAAIRLNEGRFDEAESMLLQIVEAEQFHPGANLNLAHIHRNRAQDNGTVLTEEANNAINRIRLSLAGDAMNVSAYEVLAAVYYDLGRFELAQLVCLNAVSLELDSARLRNRLGLILLAQDDVTNAYAQFRQAASLEPDFTEAWMNLGAIALNYRDYDSALTAFENVLTTQDDHLDAMISRGVALRGLDDLAGAEQAYQDVLALDDAHLAALFNLGVLYEEHYADYQGAVDWFADYIRADINGRSEMYDYVDERVAYLRELIELLGPSQPIQDEPIQDEPIQDEPIQDEPIEDGGWSEEGDI